MADDDVLTSLTLLDRLRQPGDEAAWSTFLDRYRPLIARWCRRRRLTHGDADEVSDAVLAKLAREKVGRFDPSQRFRPWLKAVVTNKIRDLQRQRQRRPGDWGSGHPGMHERLTQLAAPDSVDELAGELEAEWRRDLEEARRITEAVQAQVRPDHWQAFWLRAVEELPAAEVAGRLGMTVATVHVIKHRVGKLLREEGERALAARAAGGG
jgi:RNA polymerase sigma-70 factor (ECF subfamily)